MNIHRSVGFGTGAFALILSLTLLTTAFGANKPSPKTPAAKPAAAKPAAGSPKPAAQPAAHPAAAAARPATAAAKGKTVPPAPKLPPLVTLHTDFELQLGEEVMLRTVLPPLKYSDKGLIQHYTLADLKKLKGDYPELPGFPSETARLKAGQAVLVYFGKKLPTSSYGDKGTTGSSKTPDTGEAKPQDPVDAKSVKTAESKPQDPVDAKSAKTAESKPLMPVDAKRVKTAESKSQETNGKSVNAGDSKSKESTKLAKLYMPPPAGVLGGTISRNDEVSKGFTLRVDTQHEAGKVPTINSKEMLKDFEITMIVILN